MFRHAYNPHSLNTNAKTSAAYDYQCGPTTATACNADGTFDEYITSAPTQAPTKAPTAAVSYAGQACWDLLSSNAELVIKPTHPSAANDEWKVWCAGAGASKGHYQGVCRDGTLYSPKRWDVEASFTCNAPAAQQTGAVTTCGFYGRQCTDGSTDFTPGPAGSAVGPLPGGGFPAYFANIRSGITDPAPFREWDTAGAQ